MVRTARWRSSRGSCSSQGASRRLSTPPGAGKPDGEQGGAKPRRSSADTWIVVRRIVDLLLVAAILGAAGFGAFYLGRSVDTTSNTLAKRDSELGQTTYHRAKPSGPTKHTLELVG